MVGTAARPHQIDDITTKLLFCVAKPGPQNGYVYDARQENQQCFLFVPGARAVRGTGNFPRLRRDFTNSNVRETAAMYLPRQFTVGDRYRLKLK